MPPGGRRHGRYWIARFNARSRTGGVEVLPGLGSDLPVGLETAAALNGTYGDVGTFSELAVDGECVVVVGVQQALVLPHLRADHALGHDPGAVPVVAAAGATAAPGEAAVLREAGAEGAEEVSPLAGLRGCDVFVFVPHGPWSPCSSSRRLSGSWSVRCCSSGAGGFVDHGLVVIGLIVVGAVVAADLGGGGVLCFVGRVPASDQQQRGKGGEDSDPAPGSSGRPCRFGPAGCGWCGVRPGRCWCRSCSAGSGVRGCRRCGVWGCCRRHRALRPCRGSWRRGRDGGGATAGACRPGDRGRAGGRPPFRGGGLPEGRAGGGAGGRRGGPGRCGGGPGRGVRRGGRPGS